MYWYCVIIALIFLILTILFIKKRLLDIRYTLVWFTAGISMLLLSLNSSILDYFSKILNIIYPPSLLFLIGILFCFILILSLIVTITSLQIKLTRLTQEIALLKMKRRTKNDISFTYIKYFTISMWTNLMENRVKK
ncbi:DUF2304 domain-containing protein [Clostridium perfringens]|nr:DUF2304 domain-containing protein [Clostridium perfringens]